MRIDEGKTGRADPRRVFTVPTASGLDHRFDPEGTVGGCRRVRTICKRPRTAMLGASRIGRYASVSRLVQCRFASYSNWHEACDRTFCRRVAALTTRGMLMLYYAVVFFIVALIAALFGFGGIAAGAA